MKIPMRPGTAVLAVLIMVGTTSIFGGCINLEDEGFAIYLTKGDIAPAQMPALSHVEKAEPPIISMNDVITYNIQTHELKLTPGAFERISQLDVPVGGRTFVVCVDRKSIYWGAFWTPISSISFDGVTIWKPWRQDGSYILTLEMGYPSSSFYSSEDPRNRSEIVSSLERVGKLITGLSVTAVDKLPHSMKGYELYSWLEDGQWHFTLMTGTNRNKTLEEIVSNEDFISQAGWVHVQVVGVDAIKAVLSKLPQSEEVFWLAGPRSEQTPPGNIGFMLPPQPTIDAIREHVGQLDLRLFIPPLSES